MQHPRVDFVNVWRHRARIDRTPGDAAILLYYIILCYIIIIIIIIILRLVYCIVLYYIILYYIIV